MRLSPPSPPLLPLTPSPPLFSPLPPGPGTNPGPQACSVSSLTLSYSQVLDLISKKNKRTFQIAGGERESQRAFLHFQRAESRTGPCLFSLPISAMSPGTSTCQLGSAAWVRFHTHTWSWRVSSLETLARWLFMTRRRI